MKKTTILLLGALVASVLPSTGLKAQKKVYVKVQTVDKAALDSVYILGYESNTDTLCIDPTNPDLYTYTGNAVQIDTSASNPVKYNMTHNITNGDSTYCTVPGSMFEYSVIVAKDVNGRWYVLGNADDAGREQGIFRAADLFAGSDTLDVTLTAQSNMLRAGAASNATVATDGSYLYTTLSLANSLSTQHTVSLTADIAAGVTDEITNAMNLFMGSHKVLGTLLIKTDTSVYINGTEGSVVNGFMSDGTGTGTVSIDGIDSVGSMLLGSHTWEIQTARVNSITLGSTPDLTILAGKFNQSTIIGLNNHLASGRFFYNNPDEDAASFRWKVATDGYKVVYSNFDAMGHDTILRNEGGLAVNIGRPDYVSSDYLFHGYYTDAACTDGNEWDFDTASVSSDTILYAKWQYFDATTLFRVTVNYLTRNLDGVSYDTNSVVEYGVLKTAADGSTDTTFAARFIPGFSPMSPTLQVRRAAPDTAITFYYERNVYQLVWNFVNADATYDLPFDDIAYYAFGDTIVYPTHVARPGRHLSNWLNNVPGTTWNSPRLVTMPAQDVTMTAVYDLNRYNVLWTGPDTVEYDATDQLTQISAALISLYDTVQLTAADFVVTTNTGDTVTEAIFANESPYTIKAVPADTNYQRSYYIARNLVIIPCSVRLVDVVVEKVRLYEQGNQEAVVTSYGRPSIIHTNANNDLDDVFINPFTARFGDEEPGENKPITAYGVTLGGEMAGNYRLEKDTVTLALDGVILYFGLNDTLTEGFDVDFKGYCAGTSQIEFHLDEGATNPDMYSLDFVSDRFTDVLSTTVNQSGFIEINVPDNTPAGDYDVDVVFWSSAYPTIKSNPVRITFRVNFKKDIIMPMFTDVMTIMNNNPSITIDTNSIEWYRNDSLVGQGLPFYQQPGGALTGEYYVEFEYTDADGVTRHGRSCVQDNLTDYPQAAAKAAVKAFPNPTVNTVNITIENSNLFTHTLRVMNIMGVTMIETTFDGDATSIDFSRFGNGSYTVSVDGIVVRVIKK